MVESRTKTLILERRVCELGGQHNSPASRSYDNSAICCGNVTVGFAGEGHPLGLDKGPAVREKVKMRSLLPLAALAAATATPATANQQPIAPERPEVIDRITACRTISGSAERLACFDREVGALEAAAAARQIAVVDREQVRRARRSLFGLRLPDLGVFGDDSDEGEDGAAVTEINSTIRSHYTGADRRMHFILEDGSVWVQTDGRAQRPRAGQAIRIRRGPLGSYIANIAERVGFRVTRLR